MTNFARIACFGIVALSLAVGAYSQQKGKERPADSKPREQAAPRPVIGRIGPPVKAPKHDAPAPAPKPSPYVYVPGGQGFAKVPPPISSTQRKGQGNERPPGVANPPIQRQPPQPARPPIIARPPQQPTPPIVPQPPREARPPIIARPPQQPTPPIKIQPPTRVQPPIRLNPPTQPPTFGLRQGPVSNSYGSGSNNWASRQRVDPPPRLKRAPPLSDLANLTKQLRRIDRTQLHVGDFRFGYFQYRKDFHDNWFRFNRYSFSPFYTRCVPSPWYFYWQLPPYIISTQVIYINPTPYDAYAFSYQWYPASDVSTGRSALDEAIDDIVYAFQSGDDAYLRPLIPRDGDVAIYLDNQYRYSLVANDFADMISDAIDNVQTEAYGIVSVRVYPDRSASVEAAHNSLDPWGRQTTVYHTYRLAFEPDGYVIREFGTSDSRSF